MIDQDTTEQDIKMILFRFLKHDIGNRNFYVNQ